MPEPYGQPPAPWVEDYEVEETGLHKATVVVPLAPNEPGGSVQDVLRGLPEPPRLDGLAPVNYRLRHRVGGYRAEIRYEGGGPGEPVVFEPRGDEQIAVYAFDAADAQVPITSHPNFQALADKYAWVQDEGFARYYDPESGDAETGLRGADGPEAEGRPNPLYRVDSYNQIGGVVTKTVVREQVPANLLQGVGGIEKPDIPPHLLPGVKDRNFLKMTPRWRKRGNVVEIRFAWIMSGPGGWNPDVYDLQTEREGGGGGTLETGTVRTGSL